MRRLTRFVAEYPRFAFWLASLVIVPLLLYGCDETDRLTGAKIEDVIVGEPVLFCMTNGEPMTEYFERGGAYHLDLPGSLDDRFGRWRIDSHDRICVEIKDEAPDCRYLWRNGENLTWMWVNPQRFADFALLPEDPCEWER